MKTRIFPSNKRGTADFGWLKANYSFSFSNYFNPDNVHFGKLRVLNDDIISGGAGFATHPHANMEIISIPLKGALAHEDSTGAKGVIRPGEVQVMSAGTGIEHSEKNHISNGETNLLQLWIFPKESGIKPRYQQQFFDDKHRENKWQPVVSNLHPGALDIHQDAVLSMLNLSKGQSIDYTLNYSQNGVYLFIIDGDISLNKDTTLKTKDAIGIEEAESFKLTANNDSKILAIEVPMN